MNVNDSLRLATLAVILMGLAPPGQKTGPEIVGWGKVIDPDGDCKIKEERGKLTISIPGTHHNLNPTPPINNVRAPRVVNDAEGDFVTQVKTLRYERPDEFTSSTMRHSYVGAGLLIWQDEKNFCRFLRAANGETDRLFVSVELFRNGQFIGGHDVDTEDIPTYLKAVRLNGQFQFFVSSDARTWTLLPTPNFDLGNKVQIGVAAVNSTIRLIEPQFEDFKLTESRAQQSTN